ncbi:hypothetical protein ACLKA6_011219 [Drosophila palustris]
MPSGAPEMAAKMMTSFNQIKHFGSMFALLRKGEYEGTWMCMWLAFKLVAEQGLEQTTVECLLLLNIWEASLMPSFFTLLIGKASQAGFLIIFHSANGSP